MTEHVQSVKETRRARNIGVPLALAIIIAAAAHAQPQPAGEYQIKSAFLFNFAKFVEWPAQLLPRGDSPMIIGVLGDDPFGNDLDDVINNKTVNGRPIVIKRYASAAEIQLCHILFISTSERKDVPMILHTLDGTGVLTVSEIEQFTQLGGAVRFYLADAKVRFEINVDEADREHIRVSSKLLKLATIIREQKRE
ncbi:MAG: YfiR family protein [Ignavibacteriae bacterium]|nr:YfiR family protein [Ignavibacteriota bacterium]